MGKFAEYNDALSAVFSQETSAADLHIIAQEQPSLGHLVAGHRNTAPDTLAWLAQQGDLNVTKVLERRGVAAESVSESVQAPSKGRGHTVVLAAVSAVAVIATVALVVALVVTRFGVGASQSEPSTSVPSSTSSPTESSEVVPLDAPLFTLVGGLGFDAFNGVAVTADGGIVAVGSASSIDGSFFEIQKESAMVVMFDGEGSILWSRTIEVGEHSEFSAVAIGSDGSIYAVGEVSEPNEDEECGFHGLAVKLTPAGEEVWRLTHDSVCSDRYWDVVATDDGVTVVGHVTPDGDRDWGYDVLITRITADGSYAWSKSHGGTDHALLLSVTLGLDGTVVAVGAISARNGDFGLQGEGAALIAGFSPDGDLKWARTFSGDGFESFSVVTTTPDGKYFIAGGTTSGNGDLLIRPSSGDTVGIAGVFTDVESPVDFFTYESDGESYFLGAAVTAGGLAVTVGSENWVVGVLNIANGSFNSTKASPSITRGGFNAVAVISDSRVVAVGYAQKGLSMETGMEDSDAALVIFSVP